MHVLRASRRAVAALAALALPLSAGLAAAPVSAQESAPVSVTSPAGGSVLTGTATATVSVSSSSPVRVVYLYGKTPQTTEPLGEDTTAPYEFSFDSRRLPNGPFELIASAALESSAEPGQVEWQSSDPLTVTADNPAELELVTPQTTVLRGNTTPVTARVIRPSDCEDALTFDYTVLPTRSGLPPITVPVQPDGTATAQLDLRYTDDPQVQVTVRRAAGGTCRPHGDPASVAATAVFDVSTDRPTASFVSPANGASYTAPMTVTVDAVPAAQVRSPIREVQLYDGFTLVAVDTAAPWQFTLDPRQHRLGYTRFELVAVDDTGVMSHRRGDAHAASYAARTPVALAITPAARSVVVGRTTRLNLAAAPADPRARLDGLVVSVQARTSGTTVWKPLAAVSLTGTNTFGGRVTGSFAVAPRLNTAYRTVTVDGRHDTAPATSAQQVVTVTPTLTLSGTTAPWMTLRKGTTATLTSRLAPAAVGYRVVLQQRTATGWKNLAAAPTGTAGVAAVRWAVPRTGTSAVLRFFAPATSRLNAAAGPAFTVRLR